MTHKERAWHFMHNYWNAPNPHKTALWLEKEFQAVAEEERIDERDACAKEIKSKLMLGGDTDIEIMGIWNGAILKAVATIWGRSSNEEKKEGA